jgi:hypothetical protein
MADFPFPKWTQRDIQIGKFDGGGLRRILMAVTFGMPFAKVQSPTEPQAGFLSNGSRL